MFRVNRDGAAIGYADSLTYIRLHKNGCYIPCEKGEAACDRLQRHGAVHHGCADAGGVPIAAAGGI